MNFFGILDSISLLELDWSIFHLELLEKKLLQAQLPTT